MQLGRDQHHVFTRSQALAAGFTPRQVEGKLRRGEWLKVYRGVYIDAAVPIGWQQQVSAAVLACGRDAVASLFSAARVFGWVEDFTRPEVNVLSKRARVGIAVHETVRLDRFRHDGFSVTNPMRTLLDLAARLPQRPLEPMVDKAHHARLISIERFGVYLADPFAQARPGAGVLRALVAVRDPDAPIESTAETLLFAALRRGRLPLPQPQFWVETPRRRARIDFAYPDLMIAIEADSWKDHGTRPAFEADRARQNELIVLGWRVIRFTWRQLNDATYVASTIKALGVGPTPLRSLRGGRVAAPSALRVRPFGG